MGPLSRRTLLVSGLAGMATLARAQPGLGSVVLRAVYHEDIPPYSYLDGTGTTARGILIDLLDIVSSASGYRMSHHGFPWARAQRMVEVGDADVLCCPQTAERSRYTLFAPTPVTTLAVREIFFAKDNPHAAAIRAARSKEELYAFAMVAFHGNSTNKKNWADHPRRYEVRDIEQIFRMLLRGNADFYQADPTVTRFKLKQLGLLEDFGSTSAAFVEAGKRTHMRFGLRRSYPEVEDVVMEIDAVIKETLSPEKHDEVIARYTR